MPQKANRTYPHPQAPQKHMNGQHRKTWTPSQNHASSVLLSHTVRCETRTSADTRLSYSASCTRTDSLMPLLRVYYPPLYSCIVLLFLQQCSRVGEEKLRMRPGERFIYTARSRRRGVADTCEDSIFMIGRSHGWK